MYCSKCGAENNNEAVFCVKCGAKLGKEQNNNSNDSEILDTNVNDNKAEIIQEEPIIIDSNINNNSSNNSNSNSGFNNSANTNSANSNNETPELVSGNGNAQIEKQQAVSNQNQSTNKVKGASFNYFVYMIAILLKPIKSFKEEEEKLNSPKTSIILTMIITVFMTIINMITTIFNTVRVSNYSWTDGVKYTWEWDNIKNINWLELIGKNFLIYVCIIAIVALVFYFGGLVVKKQGNFIKMLAMSATAVVPAVIGIMILSPLGSLIWEPLGVVLMIIGGVYTILILYELVNNELKLEGDMKIYFNLICFGVLVVAGYYAAMKLFISSATNGLDNVLDMFK